MLTRTGYCKNGRDSSAVVVVVEVLGDCSDSVPYLWMKAALLVDPAVGGAGGYAYPWVRVLTPLHP